MVPNTDTLKGFGCVGGGKRAGGLGLSFGCFLARFSYLIALCPPLVILGAFPEFQ